MIFAIVNIIYIYFFFLSLLLPSFLFVLHASKEASSHQNSAQKPSGEGHTAKHKLSVYARLKSPRDFCHAA